jgi:ABC-type phosphate transport system auxiliary subunit
MNRKVLSFFCAATLLAALTPAAVMAAKNPARAGQGAKIGKQNRQEMKQLKAEMKALRSQMKAAKANGKLSKEDRARFKAERNRLRSEMNALNPTQKREL